MRLVAVVVTSISLVAAAVLGAVGVEASATPQGPTDGMVLRYAFDGQHHGFIPDLSGSGLDGSVIAPAGAKVLKPSLAGYDKAIQLDGQQHEYVAVPVEPVLDLNQFTIAAWIRYTGVENDQTFGRWEVLEKAGAYWLNIRTNGAVRAGGFFGGCTSASWQFLDSSRHVKAGAWRHVAATYDGSQLTIYIGGKAAGSMPVTGRTCASAEPLAVGAKNNPTKGLLEAFWDGRLDEVRLYDHALTQAEVGQLCAR